MSNFFDLILISSHLTTGILILILSIVAYAKLNNSSFKFIENIAQNWNEGPILSITPRVGKCIMGEVSLIEDEWPGTVDGCDCSSIGSKYYDEDSLLRKSCSSNRRDRTFYCRQVPEIYPIKYTSWAGKTICGRRLNMSYLDLNIVQTKSDCKSGSRSCGVVDTKDNVLCVPNESDCPVNKIIILEQGEEAPKDFKYQSFALDDGKTLLYTNENTEGELIHEFKISQKTPCIDSSYYNMIREPYKLSTAWGRTSCPILSSGKSEDNRVERLDSDSLTDFQYYNGVEQILRRLPLYQPPPNSLEVTLFTREYYGLNVSCRADVVRLGQDQFMKNMVIFEPSFNSLSSMMMGVLIASIVIIFLVVGAFFFVVCSATHDGLEIHFILNIGYFVVGLILLVLTSLAVSRGGDVPKDYMLLTKDGCGDQTTDEIITNFSVTFGSAKSLNVANVFFSVLMIIFPIGFHVVGMVDRAK